MALQITPDATLIVKAPHFTPTFFINRFIKDHDEWIQKQIQKVEVHTRVRNKTYVNGEEFLFLGMKLTLELDTFTEISVSKNKLLFPQGLQFRAQKQLTSWYKKQAKQIITQQVKDFASKMDTDFAAITFADTKSQWGRCTVDNRLQFNWRLIMSPILVIQYVVVHELAHTIEKNHSHKFWHIVSTYCPSYKRQRKWLKEYGNELVV